MKSLLLSIFVCSALGVNSQTVIEAQSVTSSVGAFNLSLAPASTLGLNVDATTTSATSFLFAPGSSFVADIGYVSESGVGAGIITHTFANATSVSQVLVWNAYFDFELDHSSQDVMLTFKDALGAVITTEAVSFLEATAGNTLPEVITLATEIMGVKEIDFEVLTLWGGNEISMRRVGYAGSGISVSIDEIVISAINTPVYPNPASNGVTIPVEGVYEVVMTNVAGESVNVCLTSSFKNAKLSWENVAPGYYHLNIFSSKGQFKSKVVVLPN